MKTADTRFLWSTVRLPRHGAGPRIGDEERRLMHLVPAPAVRLMKRRVLSRPGLKSLMLAWLDVSCHVPGAKTIGQAVDKFLNSLREMASPVTF